MAESCPHGFYIIEISISVRNDVLSKESKLTVDKNRPDENDTASVDLKSSKR